MNTFSDDERRVHLGVLDDEATLAMRERNEARAKAAIAQMGESYACHPANHVQRQPNAPDVQPHIVRQYSDQMMCSCGLAWDVNDPEPPEGH